MKNNYIKVERKINQGMIAPMNGLPLKYLFFFLKSDKENILKKVFFFQGSWMLKKSFIRCRYGVLAIHNYIKSREVPNI